MKLEVAQRFQTPTFPLLGLVQTLRRLYLRVEFGQAAGMIGDCIMVYRIRWSEDAVYGLVSLILCL